MPLFEILNISTHDSPHSAWVLASYDVVSRLWSLSDNLPGTAGDVTTTFGYNYASQLTSRIRSNPSPYAWSGYTTPTRRGTTGRGG